MRTLTLALVVAITAVAVNASTGVALFDRSDAATAADVASEPRMLGIHHFVLKEGVKAADFERYVAEEWNPVIHGRVPGIPITVFKGERNADQGHYLLVYEIQSLYVRDWYWPSPTTETEASAAVWEACGDVCTVAWDGLNNMVERTDWADYIEVVRD